eukprot:m.112929 g.112929  ORF g.112929 m.112929 type:complete len:957 (+) comp10790_c0_seq2:247-3117(+)
MRGPTMGWATVVVAGAAMASAVNADLPSLRDSWIGHYEPLDLSKETLIAQHNTHRQRRAMAEYSNAKVPPVVIDFTAHGRTFKTVLSAAGSKLFANGFVAEVHTDNGRIELTDFDKTIFYHGSLHGELGTAVSAQIEDDVLVGMIHTPTEQYFIERADKYLKNPNFTNIIYKGSDMAQPKAHDFEFEGAEYEGLAKRQAEFVAEQNKDRLRRQAAEPYNPSKNTCGVALVIDKRLMDARFRSNGQYDTNAAIRDVLRLLDGSSLIYRSTTFTIDGQTRGGVAQFAAKRVVVYTTDTGNPYAGQATCATSSQAGSCPSNAECAQGFLDMLTTASPNTTVPNAGWDDFCLVHAFTYRDFCGGILGLAWVASPNAASAGICARRSGGRGSLNSGISTMINFGQDVSTQVQIITLAHEFGHNFGSNHDTAGLVANSGAQCAPANQLGNYIMYVKATDGDQENNDHFSDCSKESISDVIFAHSSSCFEIATSYTCGATALVGGSCGNGIIDVNEECECSGVADPHCDCNTCSIVPGKECSFASGDPCCDSNGMLLGRNLTETLAAYRRVLNSTASTDIRDINTALDAEFGTASRCAEGAECAMNRYCIKDTRFVAYTGQDIGSCPQIDFVANLHNETEMAPTGVPVDATSGVTCFNLTANCPVDDVTTCSSLLASCDDALANNLLDGSAGNGSHCYLFHMSNQASCNSGNSLCRSNGCTGSVCGTFARVDGGSDGATRCRITNNEAKSCHLACNFGGSEGCVSTFDFNTTYPNQTGISGLFLSPGRSCTIDGDEFGGRCNDATPRTCTALTTPFANSLSPSAVGDWIQDNWPLVLGLVGGAILLAILLKVTYVKKKPQIKMGLSKAADTIRRRTGMPKSNSSSSRAVGGDAPPLTSAMRNDLRQKMKKEEALARLQAFFPKTDEAKVARALRHSRNEEEAVKSLLKQKEPFAVPQRVPLLE